MNAVLIDEMKGSLLKLKEEIIRNLISENSDFNEIIKDLDPKDLADIAADDIDRKTLEALSSNDVRRLRLIDSALSRMKNERYGTCMRCNKKIPEERLKAIPYALMCIECKNSDEKNKR